MPKPSSVRLYRRTVRSGKRIFYAQLQDPETGAWSLPRSTGVETDEEAQRVVGGWQATGLPASRPEGKPRPLADAVAADGIVRAIRAAGELTPEDAGRVLKVLQDRGLVKGVGLLLSDSPMFVDYLRTMWDRERSPYLRNEALLGRSVTRGHADNAAGYVRRHVAEAAIFQGVRLGEVTRKMLLDFRLELANAGKLAPRSINYVMSTIATALKWAAGAEMIAANPAAGLGQLHETPKQRGLLEPEEVRALFRVAWPDPRARTASLLGAAAGLRRSEVLGLQVGDVEAEYLRLAHAWTGEDRLKGPKNGRPRIVPLLPTARLALMDLVAMNPYGQAPDVFIFWGARAGQPCSPRVLDHGLHLALEAIGVDDAARRQRNLTFHGWRHWNNTMLRGKLPDHLIRKTIGHASEEMTARYTGRLDRDLRQVATVSGRVLGGLLAEPGEKKKRKISERPEKGLHNK